MPKVWYRASKQAYYLQIDRRTQRRLGRTLKEAEAAYRQWLIDRGEALPAPERKNLTLEEVAQEFLDQARAHTKPKTSESYCYFVVPFVERFGSVPAATFPPLSFIKWRDEHEGWKGWSRPEGTVPLRTGERNEKFGRKRPPGMLPGGPGMRPHSPRQ